MYSILDIDLDYFNLMPDAVHRLEQLLNWAACPVSMVVERHNHAFARWRKKWQANGIAPSHILHVDEHHDMMGQRQQTNIANFMFHAMRMCPHSAECIGWCNIPSTRPLCGWKTKRGTHCDVGSATGLTALPSGQSQMLFPFARVQTSLFPTWRQN
ncbi:MAG: hypothetical protein AABZ63_07600 [Actinomycetota bacterium]